MLQQLSAGACACADACWISCACTRTCAGAFTQVPQCLAVSPTGVLCATPLAELPRDSPDTAAHRPSPDGWLTAGRLTIGAAIALLTAGRAGAMGSCCCCICCSSQLTGRPATEAAGATVCPTDAVLTAAICCSCSCSRSISCAAALSGDAAALLSDPCPAMLGVAAPPTPACGIPLCWPSICVGCWPLAGA